MRKDELSRFADRGENGYFRPFFFFFIKCVRVDSELFCFHSAMADTAADRARREARRRRILENSENRMSKITGRYKENSAADNLSNDVTYSLPKVDDSIGSKILAPESRSILEQKHLNFLEQDQSFDIKDYELDDGSTNFQNPDDLFSSDYTIRHTTKASRDTFNSVNSKPANSQQNLDSDKSKKSFLFTLVYSPMCSIFLAAFMNVLLLGRVNLSVYESLIVPYLIIAFTRLCFQYKAEKSQGSSMLVAALILCNIRPEIVHTLKKVLAFTSTFFQGFALYITSFTLINWVISFVWKNSNSLDFF